MVIQVDRDYEKIYANGKNIHLRPSEYKLLLYFINNRRLISLKELKNTVYDEIQSNNSIVQTISMINRSFPRKIIVNRPHRRVSFIGKYRGVI